MKLFLFYLNMFVKSLTRSRKYEYSPKIMEKKTLNIFNSLSGRGIDFNETLICVEGLSM